MDDLESRTNDIRYSHLRTPEPRIYRILPRVLTAIGCAAGVTLITYGAIKDSKEGIMAGIAALASSAYAFYKFRQLDKHIDEQKPL